MLNYSIMKHHNVALVTSLLVFISSGECWGLPHCFRHARPGDGMEIGRIERTTIISLCMSTTLPHSIFSLHPAPSHAHTHTHTHTHNTRKDTLCSYVEQQVAGRDITLHTVFYNMEPLTTGLVIPGRDGGRWGDEGEIEECLRQITRAGGGRFHHFKLSGQS